jgi:hypothetical protein
MPKKKGFTLKFKTDKGIIMTLVVIIFLLLVSNTILASFLWKAKRIIFDKIEETNRIQQQYEKSMKYM